MSSRFWMVLGCLALNAGQGGAQLLPPAPGSVRPIPPDSVCDHPGFPFVGSCETVHGRLSLSLGPPTILLWKIGTHRVLALWGSGETDSLPCPLPWPLEQTLIKGDKLIYADYVVRPVTQDEPGSMRYVCVARASHIVTRPAYFINPPSR